MTRSIQSIAEITRHAHQCAEQGEDISVADDLEQDVREIWVAAYGQWFLDQANKTEMQA